MDKNKKEHYRRLGEAMIKRFERRNIDAVYCDSADDARETVLKMMPKGSSVTWGGSMTLAEIGLLDAVKNGDFEVIDRDDKDPDEDRRIMLARQTGADYFLMSTNAFTSDGELVNIDGVGSRLSFLISGPAHVIVVCGMNKYALDVHSAMKRIHEIASPANCIRLDEKTPCAKTGICGDCLGGTICCQEVITRYSMLPGRITVVMVGEDLGY